MKKFIEFLERNNAWGKLRKKLHRARNRRKKLQEELQSTRRLRNKLCIHMGQNKGGIQVLEESERFMERKKQNT